MTILYSIRLFLPFGIKIIDSHDWLSYLFIYRVFVILIHLSFYLKTMLESREKHGISYQKYEDSSTNILP